MPKFWKAVHSKKQIAKKTKWAIVALAVIFGIIIIGRAVKLTESFFALDKKLPWNGQFNINVIILAKGISLLSFSPKNEILTLIDIPDTTYLEVAKGFGKWELRSVHNLGGEKLLKDTLKDFFAVPIDGFLNFSSEMSQKEPDDIVTEIRKNPVFMIFVSPSLKTDLSPFELLRLKMGLSKVRFDKVKHIKLDKENILAQEVLADGSQVLTADPVRLDSILAELIDPSIQSEHISIAVFNSTDKAGLAQKASRLITNIGGDVIITANAQNKFKATRVYGERSKTLERLKQIFENTCQDRKKSLNCDKIDSNLEELVSSRAQINIVLGEDYLDSL